MKTVIIDSGISLQYKDFQDRKIECIDIGTGTHDENGHGTACCGECLLIDEESDLLVIKVLDESASGSLLNMVDALEYCISRQDIGIVSISISCVVEDEEIICYVQQLVDELYNRGVLLVAANKNGKDTGFPASLAHVMSVSYKKSKGETECFIHIGEKGIYYGRNRLMPRLGESYKFFAGNSSAVPRAASLLGKSIRRRGCRPAKLLGECKIQFFKPQNQRVIKWRKFVEIMEECRGLWITKKGCRTEEDCMEFIQFLEERGDIEVDKKAFSTADFSCYRNFYKKCFKSLVRRV